MSEAKSPMLIHFISDEHCKQGFAALKFIEEQNKRLQVQKYFSPQMMAWVSQFYLGWTHLKQQSLKLRPKTVRPLLRNTQAVRRPRRYGIIKAVTIELKHKKSN